VQCSKEDVSWSKWLIGLGVVLLSVVPLGLYFWVFGPLSGYRLSETDQSWANLGSFLGGTVGPIFSGLAFLGIWKTYNLQKQQLDFSIKQSSISELIKLSTITSERIEALLQEKFKLSEWSAEDPITLETYLKSKFNLIIQGHITASLVSGKPITFKPKSFRQVFHHESIGKTYIEKLNKLFNELSYLTDQLTDKYHANETFIFLKMKHCELAKQLYAVGILEEEIANKFADLNEIA